MDGCNMEDSGSDDLAIFVGRRGNNLGDGNVVLKESEGFLRSQLRSLRKEVELLKIQLAEAKKFGVMQELIETVDPGEFLAAANEHLKDFVCADDQVHAPQSYEPDTHPLMIDLV